ncbi:MAG: hemerythrin domain-containing protein [Proteobacteria bacterium]|jgi:hemerythrin-like domain-containing protein|nr:hemerythrin domain-containing protein [Pseudomonadota bacterium]
MNITRFENDHEVIQGYITTLRELSRAGTAAKAKEIATAIVQMSGKIKLHLAAEDATLYPAMEKSSNADAMRAARAFQSEMGMLATGYAAFVARWNTPTSVAHDPEGFRADANEVLKALFQRIQREDRELYPLAQRV